MTATFEHDSGEPERGKRFLTLKNLLPIIVGVDLFALGVFALYRLLKPVHAADVIAQVRATPWSALIAASGATALSYVALVGYDWSALRYLGKMVPARIVAVSGFLGYSFGNTIGISIISDLPKRFINFLRNFNAALRSRHFVTKLSSTSPSWSNARQRQCRSPLIFTSTSSRCHRQFEYARSCWERSPDQRFGFGLRSSGP
jgi:hypothetical protein